MTRLLIFTFLISTSSLFAQKNLAEPEYIAFAKQMSAIHEDSPVASFKTLIDITFDFDKKNEKVSVEVVTKEKLVSLIPSLDYNMAEFFNSQSEVKEIRVTNNKKKNIIITPSTTSYSSEGIFYDDVMIKYYEVEFPTIGTVRNVITRKEYKDIRYFTTEYLNTIYPRKDIELRYNVPNWLNIGFLEKNFENVKRQEDAENAKGLTTITFKAENLAPQVSENYGKGGSHLYPHVLLLYKGYDFEEKSDPGFQGTADLYRWYREVALGMNNEPEAVAAKAKELTESLQTDEEKIKAVYYWVQENIRYIAFEDGIAGFRPANCQDVYQKKYGDCKGMANLTKEMLKSLGYDARLTWIGTRRLAYDYSTPSLAVDNHMICAVKYKDEFVFLDATEEFNEFGKYAERIQGRPVLIEEEDSFVLSQIPTFEYKDNTRSIRQELIVKDEKLVGKSELILEGQSKDYFLYKLNNLKQNHQNDALKTYLNNGENGCRVENIESTDLKKRDGNIKINYDFVWKNGVAAFGEEMYIDLDFEKEFSDWTFSERKTDYLFNYKTHLESEVVLNIPEDYKVVTLPAAFERVHEDFFFKINYSQQDGKIIFRKEIAMPNSEVKNVDFDTWNSYIKDLSRQYKEQIVLKKGV